jgi:hypothetical protein
MRLTRASPIEHRHRLPVASLGFIRLVLTAVYCREQRQNMRGLPLRACQEASPAKIVELNPTAQTAARVTRLNMVITIFGLIRQLQARLNIPLLHAE